MTDARLALDYLCPGVGGFWSWSEDGQALLWRDGPTIAFLAEVEAVLAPLVPGGLPPFGALVMLLGACREGGRELLRQRISAFVQTMRRFGAGVRELEDDAQGLLSRLDGLAPLPTALADKVALVAAVFEGPAGRADAERAGPIHAALVAGLPAEALSRDQLRPALGGLANEIALLAGGLAGLDRERLARRARSGLDQGVLPAPAVGPAPDAIRALLAGLGGDPELGGLARLTRALLGVVGVPRPLGAPDTLPLGGVSDLSTRGSLDRLLVSELAHDGLTLATRVALGEALYLRREAPPRRPPTCREVLVDVGIRLWGVPRVFAIAVGLALAGAAEPGGVVRLHKSGDPPQPLDPTTRAGWLDQLAALDTAPHPGAAIATLWPAPSTDVERVVVTHAATAADPAFVAALAPLLGQQPLYLATVDGDGQFELQALLARGRRSVRRARFALGEVLAPARTVAPLRDEPHEAGFPLALQQRALPLQLSHPLDPGRLRLHPEHGLVSLTRDGRLMHWPRPRRGAIELTARVPAGQLLDLAIDDDATARVLIGRPHGQQVALVVADLTTGHCARHDLPLAGRGGVVAAVLHRQVAYVIRRRRVDLFCATRGESLATLTTDPGTRWRHGRFLLRPGEGWFALAFDGLQAHLERLTLPEAPADASLWYWLPFDRPAHDGPWAVTREGAVVSLAGAAPVTFVHGLVTPVEILGVSGDGQRVAIRGQIRSTSRWPHREADKLLDLERGEVRQLYGDPRRALEPDVGDSTYHPQTLRRRVRAVALGVDDRLVLIDGSRARLTVALDDPQQALLLVPDAGPEVRHERRFEPMRRPAGTRVPLKIARWPDGRAAILDGRGLLHLIPARPDAGPELMLTLPSSGPLAVWSSDGAACGPSFYRGALKRTPAASLLARITEFVRGTA